MISKSVVLLTAVTALLSTVASSAAEDPIKQRLDQSPRHLEWIKVTHDQRSVESFIAYPESHDKATVVVLIHEIFGLSDWVRSTADELAEAGYIAIAPDLLSGTGPNGGGTAALGGADGARKMIGSLPPAQVTADLNAVVDYAAKLPASNGKVIVAGFCWGGSQAFRFATNNHDIKAALVFYGTAPENAADLARISCPIYGFYGGNDARVSATVPKTVIAMKTAQKVYEPEIYEGAGHGFMRAGEAPDATPANRAARDAAWKRWLETLKKF
jgi:carboxymethylenebutenolidase